jgi:hypothetical protein
VEQQAHEIALASQTSPSQRSRFWYGSDGQRYKREDTATGQSTKRTLYLGSVEIIQQGGVVTTKRYIAGIVVFGLPSTDPMTPPISAQPSIAPRMAKKMTAAMPAEAGTVMIQAATTRVTTERLTRSAR